MTSGRAWSAIDSLAEAYFDDSVALDPLAATGAGTPGHDHRLPDLDPAWHEECSRLRRRTLAALAVAEPVDVNDRITAAALGEQLEVAEELHDADEDLSDLDNLASPHHAIRGVFDLMPTASAEDWATVVARLGAVPLAAYGELGTFLRDVHDMGATAQEIRRDASVESAIAYLDIGSVGLDVLRGAALDTSPTHGGTAG